ncbi:MAG: GNAT family N-acetyltransferase [Patescibacteria group bacterium]|jgi:aminoglycoside 6'-N-acetyltransferase I
MDFKVLAIKSEKEILKLAPLFTRVFSEKPYNEKWDKKSALKRLKMLYNEAKGLCLYAEKDGKVVGLIFCQQLTWPDGNHIIIEDLVVDKNFRRKKVAASLLSKLEALAKKKGIPAIDLLVNSKAEAPKFWKNQGYRQTAYVQYTKNI